jgi:predicted unusual protein kinase regulating ubiquinone biosynthesis (AarF/ABC1/UbiB family)
MEDIFMSFEEKPIGSASIAQAYQASTLHLADGSSGERVIVKIQYPKVAKLFQADLSNLELVTKLFMPENVKLVQALRKRHKNELDFTREVNNLRECSHNMQINGLEPALVRIPLVKNKTGICTENVLVMEYLQGTSLVDAIQQEQDRVAYALGKKDAKALRATLTDRIQKHFEDGGGPGLGGMELVGDGKAKLIQVAGPTAAMVLRTYAHV